MPNFPKKMKKGDVEFQHKGDLLAVKWHDKRDVHVLSSVHSSQMVQSGRVDFSTGSMKVKPTCVMEYNDEMGSVDKVDMQNSDGKFGSFY